MTCIFIDLTEPGVLNSELAWIEQRQYETLVLDTLGPNHTLTKSILRAFKDLETIDFITGMSYNIDVVTVRIL